MQLTILDVFAERAYAGNQLAVVRGAADLSTEQMQAIALETNFSETTFVTQESDHAATVRIFTPREELPFAGHPTVGTAWLLAGGTGAYTLRLAAGEVPVAFVDGIGWMQPPPVALGDLFDAADAAGLIGLDVADLDEAYPSRLAEVGPRFVLIGVKSLTALRRARLDADLHRAHLEAGRGVQCVFVFTAEAYGADADFASRMFFEAGGIREDPATGSANTAFAAYLTDLRGTAESLVVDQGVEIGRPSRLYLRTGDPIRVGGRVFEVLSGTLGVLP